MQIRVFLCLWIMVSTSIHAAHVGILIVATGRYVQFVPQLIESAQRYLLSDHDKTYFVFTDGILPDSSHIVPIYQERLGWPYDTLMRCAMYASHVHLYTHIDYLFALDADMVFVDTVGNEILGERVATRHPGFLTTRGTYEINPVSKACVQKHEGKYYFAGGFHGGTRDEFIKLASTMHQNIQADLAKDYVAVWHDESHLNRYFIDNPPTIILSASYCCPGNKQVAYPRKLVALDKNHALFRR